MSKVMLALGSFIVGACSMLLALSFIHTPTRVHADQGPPPTIDIVGVEPKVPPLMAKFVGGGIGGALQPLDGLDCEGCVIKPDVLTYGGGAFRCVNCIVSAKHGLTLKGAALNTFNLLRLLGVIPSPPQPPLPRRSPEERANMMIEKLKTPASVTWVSLGGLK